MEVIAQSELSCIPPPLPDRATTQNPKQGKVKGLCLRCPSHNFHNCHFILSSLLPATLTQLTPHLPAMSLPSTETFHPSLWTGRACILSNTNVPKLAPFLRALHARLREMATGA